jgi:site-specific recombinase XerD
MSQTVSETFRNLSKVRLINNPFAFPGEKSGTHRTDLPKYWEDYLRQAGIENFRWHDLRHTFASRLVMSGVDLYTVKELLGDSDFKMTMR